MLRANSGYSPPHDSLQGFLKKSLLLHVIVLALVFVLPYLHTPPKVKPPQVIEAVLVAAPSPKPVSKPARTPTPPKAEPQPLPPEPVPEPVKPTPVPEAPKPLQKTIPQPAAKPDAKTLPKPEPAKPEPKPAPEKTVTPKPAKPKPLIKPPTLNASAFDKEMQALQKEAMEADMRREAEKANQQIRNQANLAIRDKYQRLINDRVQQKWNRPLSARNGMVTVLRISVLPGGEVANVVTIQSSGNPAFDASAEEAVRRSSPLPVPDDPTLFNQYFRTITFKFSPEDL